MGLGGKYSSLSNPKLDFIMRIDVLTLFPDLINSFISQSLIGQSIKNGNLDIRTHNFRDSSKDKHKSVDDSPFGGGPGMVLKPEPIHRYVQDHEVMKPIIYLSPTGKQFSQDIASELAASNGFTLLCGRYEGVDDRIRTNMVDQEISIGDYVLAGGEAAALVVIEAVCRLIPGVLGNNESAQNDTFSEGLLEYPQYTRPAEFNGWKVPKELLSGDHELVARWRLAYSLHKTAIERPDLIEIRGGITTEEHELLNEFGLSV